METPKKPPAFPDGIIQKYVRVRVCARCYGDLEIRLPAKGSEEEKERLLLAVCPACGDDWHFATVSRRYAEQLGQQNLVDYYELMSNRPLAESLGLLPAPREEDQILSDLGFS